MKDVLIWVKISRQKTKNVTGDETETEVKTDSETKGPLICLTEETKILEINTKEIGVIEIEMQEEKKISEEKEINNEEIEIIEINEMTETNVAPQLICHHVAIEIGIFVAGTEMGMVTETGKILEESHLVTNIITHLHILEGGVAVHTLAIKEGVTDLDHKIEEITGLVMDKISELGVHAIMTVVDLHIMEEDQHTVTSTIETVIVVMTVTVEGHMNVGARGIADGQMMLGGEKERRRGNLGEMGRREGTEVIFQEEEMKKLCF